MQNFRKGQIGSTGSDSKRETKAARLRLDRQACSMRFDASEIGQLAARLHPDEISRLAMMRNPEASVVLREASKMLQFRVGVLMKLIDRGHISQKTMK
ncbi:hypothetical protein ASC97_31415 [Rhizobium sp. Root1203]|nr:hypothetical protein ASC97_31415 [Rhizobium sp. Root1203]